MTDAEYWPIFSDNINRRPNYMIRLFLAFKFKRLAQCLKNKLINKRETILGEK